MKVVVMAGIPGSGSTTVLETALEKLNYINVNYGDEMLQIAKDQGIVEDRDELRKLSASQQKEIQKGAAKSIKEKSENQNIIVDTHCTIKTPAGYLPGLPEWVLSELQPDTFIIIEADAEEIFLRRISDETRVRDVEPIDDINTHQQMNRAASMAYSVLTGATVKIIKNHDHQVESAVADLVDTLS